MGFLEIIGAIFVWAMGLALSLYTPVFVVSLIWPTGDGLSDLMIGAFWGKVFAALYVLGSVAYLAAT